MIKKNQQSKQSFDEETSNSNCEQGLWAPQKEWW